MAAHCPDDTVPRGGQSQVQTQLEDRGQHQLRVAEPLANPAEASKGRALTCDQNLGDEISLEGEWRTHHSR